MAFTLKRGDTKPILVATLMAAGVPQDLSGAVVTVSLVQISGLGFAIHDAACAVLAPATAGQVQYTWLSTDTVVPGQYNVEFHVTFQDGSKATFPNDGYATVVIEPRL